MNENGKILIVDDEEVIRMLITRVLGEAGYATATAGNGLEALEQLDNLNTELSLVIMDITMPGLDGLGTLKSLREHYDVPVIIITGRRDTDAMQDAFELGADDFVRKPFRPTELLARVRAKLRRSN